MTIDNLLVESQSALQASSTDGALKMILSKLDDRHAKVMAILERQNSMILALVSKMEVLRGVTNSASENHDRITRLEEANAQLAREISELRSSLQISPESSSAEIMVSGMPIAIEDSPPIIVQKIFSALGVPDLITKVLEI